MFDYNFGRNSYLPDFEIVLNITEYYTNYLLFSLLNALAFLLQKLNT